MRPFNFNAVRLASSIDQADSVIRAELEKYSPKNPPSLSDALAQLQQGGQPLLEALAMRDEDMIKSENLGSRYYWTIEVLCDQWGRKYKPGEKVTREMRMKHRDRQGRIYTADDVTAFKVAGTYNEMFVTMVEYTVDDKGCIRVPFRDAVHFLWIHGIHSISRKYLGQSHNFELSTEPVEAPDGSKKHVHYWRFREVYAEEYEKLPALTQKHEEKGRK